MRMQVPVILLTVLLLTLPAIAADSVSAQVSRDFRTFCDSWLDRKSGAMTCSGADGRYIAQFVRPAGHYSCEVIPTGAAAAPYVGKLCYRAITYCSSAATPEQARLGPFHQSPGYPVTEIFLFQNGVWTY